MSNQGHQAQTNKKDMLISKIWTPTWNSESLEILSHKET